MITIYVHKNPETLSLRVTADGHANTAPHGEDSVCAAVSALIYGFAEELHRLDPKHVHGGMIETGQQAGHANILIHCADERTYRRVLYNLAPMERSIEMLAEKYPEAVTLKSTSLSP